MKKEYFNIYPLQASIHTVTVRSLTAPDVPSVMSREVLKTATYLKATERWSMQINPNKINGDIFSYREYCDTMNNLFARLKIANPIYYRTDIRIDSYQDTFKQFYKINLLIISLFAMNYKKNFGKAMGQICLQSREYADVSYSNEYIEMKYYDKKLQTRDQDPAKARLEIRCLKTMRNKGLPPHEFANMIFGIFDKLAFRYEELQNICNQILYGEYLNHCKYCGGLDRKRDFTTEFLSSYHNTLTIFTRKQLRSFLVMCGLTDTQAYDRAEYIIRKTKIEFFSGADIRQYIEKLKGAMTEFFKA